MQGAEQAPKPKTYESLGRKKGIAHVVVLKDSLLQLIVSNSFLFLVVRHLLLEAMHLLLVAYCF